MNKKNILYNLNKIKLLNKMLFNVKISDFCLDF